MPKTILLADDSVTIQKVVAISFASEDVTVVTVDNGDDAITKAQEIRPDIVLADVVMPGKNGYEVCEAIKADPELAQIPVLLLTGTFEAFDESRASEVGSAGHIAKPFEAQSLINEVRRLIDAAAASATPPPTATLAESAEDPAANDGAFDFFDEEEGAPDLAPDASRSGDQPFDFALAEEVTDPIDPLADFDSVPPVGADDLAQATVIDPLGASGYDVSSSDLGPPLADTRPDPPAAATTRADEAELTMLAPEAQPEANAWLGTDPIASVPIASDPTSVVGQDPVYEGFSTPPQVEPIAVAVDEDAPADLAAELYAEPVPAEVAETPAASAAKPVDGLMAAIGPELRRQLHDTLEKIAWDSFGDLTEAIVRQSVERVESIAWEVIPRMAETLIQEEIRRMKSETDEG